jgi:hypothetical protein
VSDPTISAEADAHVARALDRIEEAQRELGRACAELSSIIGGAGQWKRIRALYDRVHAEWYRVHGWAEKHRGRLDLDGIARAALAPPSGEPASEPANATERPGAEAPAKSDVASDSSSQGGE